MRDTRETGRNTGHGKNSKQVIDTWDVVGIEGLNTAANNDLDSSCALMAHFITPIAVCARPYAGYPEIRLQGIDKVELSKDNAWPDQSVLSRSGNQFVCSQSYQKCVHFGGIF